MHLTATSLSAVLLGLTLNPSVENVDTPAAPAAPVVVPVCNAGGPYQGECVNGVATVTLDGSASFDPNGQPLEFFWSVECQGAVIVNQTSPVATLMYTMNGLCTAKCGRVDLFVRNPQGEFSRCGTQVTFADSQPPTITCPPDVMIAEGDPTDPSFTGMATASDLCNPSPTVTWSDTTSTGPNGETIITRTWSVDDGCYRDSCVQVITIPVVPANPGMDIKPTSCPNPVQLGSKGVIPVALCGAAGFDVSQVDTSTLLLSRNDGVGGSVSPLPNKFSIEDTATPFGGDLCDCHTLGGDMTLDLNMKFDKQAVEAALQLAGVASGTYLQLDLSGAMLDGTPFTVSDCIRVQ